MEQDEKLTKKLHIRQFFICCLFFIAMIAFDIQFLTEMSPLLKIYDWLIGIGVAWLYLEGSQSKKQPPEFSKPLIILGWIIGIFGVIIYVVYYDYVDEAIKIYGTHHHTRS